MVSSKLSILEIPFSVHKDASGKQLGAVISQNNKPISLFLGD